MILPWLRTPHHLDDDVKLELEEEECKSDPPMLYREREYCPDCINSNGELKCSRTHRCMTCLCHLTDDEWFSQK